MLVRLRLVLSAAAVAACLSGELRAQAPAQSADAAEAKKEEAKKEPQWKDRAEYDLVQSIGKADPKKRIELLNQWKQKYPATDFAKLRLLYFLETHQQLNDVKSGMEVAKEILAADPKDVRALNFIAYYTPLLNNTAPEALDLGEKAARGLLDPATFDDSKKPANVTAEQWKQARTQSEAQGHKTLGWIAMIRKQNEPAEQALKKSLSLNPGQGDVYYWLANVVAAQRDPNRQSEVLYRYARAAVYDGPGALPPAGRKDVEGYLTKAYTQYHGDTTGLEELKKLAKNSIDPPAGFTVDSKADIAQKKVDAENEFLKNNPMLALWMNVKKELTSDNGPAYFDSSMKDAALPRLKGKVVSQTPATRPKEIVIAVTDETTPEITLKLDAPMATKAEPGTPIEFEGASPKSFTREPFMVVMEIEKDKITGWPAPAAKPAKRKPAARKRR